MHSPDAVLKSRSTVYSYLTLLSFLIILLLSGCSNELPNDSEQGDDLTLATKIERAASVRRVNNLAQTVRWEDDGQRLQISGFNARGQVTVLNAATGQRIGAAFLDDDDDRRSSNLALRNIAAIPCSVSVQVGGQIQVIPVQNAPSNCVGISATPAGGFHVDEAKWKASSNKLEVKGNGAFPRELVSVFDAVTGQLLGTDQASATGRWKIKARNLLVAPCVVSIVSATQVLQADVTNASFGCGNIPVLANPVGGIPGAVNTFNQAPDGVIVGPIADMAISVGSSVNFMGTGFDPDSNATLSYRWDFDGAGPDSLQQNANVVFATAGVYRVTLTVTDSLGMVDPTPDTRVIVVQPNVFNNQTPSGQITAPLTNVEINAGQSVFFSGAGVDPEGTQLQYVWNFAGGAMNSTQAEPGNVFFNTPGVYLVSLSVIDAAGLADPTPEVVAVTVRGGNTGIPVPGVPTTPGLPPSNPINIAPEGEIVSPAGDMNVTIGQTVSFMATAFDPDSVGGGLSYRWDFGGLAPVSTQLNPAPITFNTPGVYVVTFTVTDALGMADPTPSVRTIVVAGAGTGTGGGVGQGPNGLITFPTNNQTISVGQSISFSGSGFDASNPNALLTYRWDFGGAAPASTLQNPGAVVFNQPGTYSVTFTVRSSSGVQDLTPDVRTITVLASGSGSNNPGGNNFANLPPNGQINSPATDVVINLGDSIDFAGFGTDPENNSPLIYSWDFDGAATDMLVQNPGKQIFSRAGSYRVRLTVIDANGNADPTPAVRMITVRDPLITNLEPNGTITSPATSMTVNVGEFVNFSGFGSDPDGSGFLTYEWDFGGVAPVSTLQNPGSIQFNEAGIVKVTLYVKDSQGYYDSTPEVRFITVQGATNVNQAPVATIMSPATDLVVNVGDTVSFIGSGQDLDNFGSNLTYMWNFGGVLPNSSLAAPGPVTFNTPGTYTISLTVMDNFGQSDMTPATRTIVVRNSSLGGQLPVVNLLSPSQALSTISVGQTLNFSAAGSAQGSGSLNYEWNFDGAAADSNLQNPGQVRFNTPGTYRISVVAINANGLRSTPATVTVTVQRFGQIPSQQAPDSTIISPANNMTVSVGDTINFLGQGTDLDANLPLSYRWSFDGAAGSSYTQNPGNVTFNKVGTYQVKLSVSDSTGATDFTPATRTITVVSQSLNSLFPGNPSPGGSVFPGNGTGGLTGAPNGIINAPSNDMTISRGQSIYFSGDAVDPDGDFNIRYSWNFGGGAAASTQKIPGNVVFNTQGRFTVTLSVTDSTGQTDSSPATVYVTVLP